MQTKFDPGDKVWVFGEGFTPKLTEVKAVRLLPGGVVCEMTLLNGTYGWKPEANCHANNRAGYAEIMAEIHRRISASLETVEKTHDNIVNNGDLAIQHINKEFGYAD